MKNLKTDLEKNLNEGKADFKLHYKAEINKKPFEVTMNFRKSDTSDMYFFEGQEGISVDEAYRFLKNRWLEKQMQAKRKETVNAEISKTEKDNHTSSCSGLLKKKRLGSSQKALII